MRRRGFEIVPPQYRKNVNEDVKLPVRASLQSMAYDFYSPVSRIVKPGEVAKIWTDVNVYMRADECLILNVRSSMGGKFMLANTQGWIDADYYMNKDNGGNIGIFLKNISNKVLFIKRGDRIAQVAFFRFLIADNGNTENKRSGGFGSTGK